MTNDPTADYEARCLSQDANQPAPERCSGCGEIECACASPDCVGCLMPLDECECDEDPLQVGLGFEEDY